jgi:predicted permease
VSLSLASWVADTRRDLLYAVRGLSRQPGFTVFVVLTLALGIGANSAIFGLLDRLLLSPPPHVREAGRVVHLLFGEQGSGSGSARYTTSYPSFRDLQALQGPGGSTPFESLAAVTAGTMVFGRGADATAIQGSKATGRYFDLLGVRPEAGRFFGEEEDRAPDGLDVAVLSHELWQSRLGGSRAVIGRTIVLDGRPFLVLGIAPPGFTGDGIAPLDVWVPLSAAMRGLPGWRESRDLNLVTVLARLKPGVAEPAARQAATAAYRRGLELSRPSDAARAQVVSLPLSSGRGPEGLTKEGRIALWLAGVALAVFLIAVGNVTNLLLLRTARRQREIAVRLALGMSRGQLVRLWMTESLLLAFLGGAVGLLFAHWGGNLTRLALLPGMAPTDTLRQPRVFLVTALAAVVAGLIAGLLPARQASASSVAQRLDPGALARSVRRSGLLTSLLLLQTGLTAVLLTGAGLFVASLYNVRNQDFGFTTERTLLAQVPIGQDRPGFDQDAFYREALERVKRLPGVEGAIPVDALPFGAHNAPPISVPGFDGVPGQGEQLPFMNAAAPDYFRMMGMTILRGRGFTLSDDARAPLVAVLSETMGRVLWPGQDPLGKCIRVGYVEGESSSAEASASLPCRQVVGIVNDVRPRSIRPEEITIMQYYIPYEQLPPPPGPGIPTISGLLIRTAGDPRAMARAVQQTLQSFGPDSPYINVRPYQELLDPQIRPWRLGATLFTLFGGLALLMAAIGLYGVLANMVAQRRKEIGIRMALGASSGRVVRDVVGEGLAITLVGLGLGGLAVLVLGRWFEPLLFGVTPRDPAVLATVVLTLTTVSVVASLIPAMRATRVDPNFALRTE